MPIFDDRFIELNQCDARKAACTTLSGVWGIPMVAHFFNISPSAASTPLLAFMICNAIGSIALGHMADRVAAALDTALIRICLLRMILIAMLLPPVAHALGLLYVNVVFAALGLRWTAAPSARSRCVHQPPVRPATEI
jgi:predicted MFS family arabinose efflux permease